MFLLFEMQFLVDNGVNNVRIVVLSFAYQVARIFNRLEKTARGEISILLFKENLKLSKITACLKC